LEASRLKIGLIVTDDGSSPYSQAHIQGLRTVLRRLRMRQGQLDVRYGVQDYGLMAFDATTRDLIAHGANIVFSTSWSQLDPCEELAGHFPWVVLANAFGNSSNGTNCSWYAGRMYEARFLAGILAGTKTKSGLIGYVAAKDSGNSEVTRDLNGFAMGVSLANAGARVLVGVTHNWSDPGSETAMADELIRAGSDVMAYHANTLLEAAKNGVFAIGSGYDMGPLAPNLVLASVQTSWEVYYNRMVDTIIDGSFSARPHFSGLETGLVSLAGVSASLNSPAALEMVANARQRITSGHLSVFGGPMETNEGTIVGGEGTTLPDETLIDGLHWYYRNIELLRPQGYF
jgi:basic membrane protein A